MGHIMANLEKAHDMMKAQPKAGAVDRSSRLVGIGQAEDRTRPEQPPVGVAEPAPSARPADSAPGDPDFAASAESEQTARGRMVDRFTPRP